MHEDERKDQSLKISIISNIIFEPFLRPLIKQYFVKLKVKIQLVSYGEHMKQEYLTQISSSDQIIVWLNLENLLQTFGSYQNLISSEKKAINKIMEACRFLYIDITQNSNAQLLWLLFEDYYTKISVATGHIYSSLADKINLKLVSQLSNRVDYIDLKRIIANVGIGNAYNYKGQYRWNAPYSKALIDTVAQEFYKQYLIEKGISKKCLVLDCDNVLWGGILSEDGIENIQLGSGGFGPAYQNFQRFVLSLFHHGVILAICSKNSLSDVMMMFREHSEMILKEKHIACFQVNWDNKVDNIYKIADTLNIGLYSMVFVDDSDFEIQSVKQLIPEITALKYERDTIYNQLSCFNLKNKIAIESINQRNNTYKTNEQRNKLKENSKSFDDYLKALDMKIDIHLALPIEYSRIAELTQRTNKCTNGTRYTVSEIKKRVNSEYIKLYSVSVSDCFSDLGLVGAIEVEGKLLTLFSLSCRALGREVEGKIIQFILEKCQVENIKFKTTGKNDALKTLFEKAFSNSFF